MISRGRTLGVSLLVIFALTMPLNDLQAIENGIPVDTATRTVPIWEDPSLADGFSGYALTNRIILTVQHGWKSESLNSDLYVGNPGQLKSKNSFRIRSEKIFLAKNFNKENFRNDFAVIVLSRPLDSVNSRATLFDPGLAQKLVSDKSKVKVTGYGFQSAKMRENNLELEIYPHYFEADFKSLTADELQIFIPAPYSVCNGDSGGGNTIIMDQEEIYIGPTSHGLGITNCGIGVGNEKTLYVPLVFKFLDTIAEADKYVSENPYIDPDKVIIAKPTSSILCAKGKIIKKILGKKPKCPSGFKLKKK
jgi:secreted trypsin-like serine protease